MSLIARSSVRFVCCPLPWLAASEWLGMPGCDPSRYNGRVSK
ncbi:hypothetical protein RISK_002708 [Rhodopirellula islandica]|uniref:Uncharacterized protein n=1 Tax=Rhodopirellula islandica TaxID=595434 RepID=A0A0J1BF72_RHOIS|nr:hypothetical protein RISK_002708 [Rhodopirellula islandica]